MMSEFREELQKILQKTVKGLYQLEINSVIEHPVHEGHGDYSSNVALILARDLKRPPLGIAEEICQQINKSSLEIVSSCVAVPPGFINFTLSEEALIRELNAILKNGQSYGSGVSGKGKTAVIEYSSPNIAKRFGVGHLRSTVIGQSLYNLYQFLGYKVVGENHLGDWGTQFGILLYQISRQKLSVDKLSVEKLEEMYVSFHKESVDHPDLKEEARAWFKKLETGDPKARQVWEAVVGLSLSEFKRVYRVLGVSIDNAHGESFYEDKMGAVIKEIRKKNLSRKSRGAEIVEFSDLPPAILVKTDGTTTYFTRDLAALKYREDTWKPDLLVYEVGSDQKLHFQQVFSTARMLGWGKETELIHIAHGLIRFAEGKMSTRRGQTIQLEEILQEAIKRARVIVEKSANSKDLSESQKQEISQALGVGAIKYFDLSHQPQTDIVFDWEKMFLLEGNSGPYLQYTYARAMSVTSKAKLSKSSKVLKKLSISKAEVPLLRYLYRFSEVVEESARNYSPNLLCNYLFDLSQRFNSFYAAAPILKAEGDKRDLRLALTAATAQVLKNGLTLLGIDILEKI